MELTNQARESKSQSKELQTAFRAASKPTHTNEYMREYMRLRYHRVRSAALILLGSKCVRCDSRDSLQFDHVDPSTKKFTLGRNMGSVSTPKLVAELAKCQLLCEPCHRLKSISDLGKTPARGTHGTLSAYRYCRCDKCKRAKSEHNRRAQ